MQKRPDAVRREAENSTTYWLFKLELSRKDHDFAGAAEAKQRLAEMGMYVRYGKAKCKADAGQATEGGRASRPSPTWRSGFYKFVKVAGEYRLTTCNAGLSDVAHCNLVQPGDIVEAAGTFCVHHGTAEMIGRSEGLNVGYGPEHRAELAKLLDICIL